MTIQPFFNFNGGWYVPTLPIITANWMAESDEQWTVPTGAGLGAYFAWALSLSMSRFKHIRSL